MKILIVESDTATRSLLLKGLEPCGECVVAETAHNAVLATARALRGHWHFDIVVIGIQRGQPDEVALTRCIRTIEDDYAGRLRRRAQIVVAVPRGNIAAARRAQDANCDYLLPAPSVESDILDLLDALNLPIRQNVPDHRPPIFHPAIALRNGQT